MEIFADKTPANEFMYSHQGKRENDLLAHISCEVERGLWRVWSSPKFRRRVPWLFYKVKGGKLYDADGTEVPLHDSKGKLIEKPYDNASDPGWGVAIYLQMQVDELTCPRTFIQ